MFTKFYKAHNIMAKSKNKIKIIDSIHVFVSWEVHVTSLQ